MNLFKGLHHMVNMRVLKEGSHALKSDKMIRPKGMSGRQWKKFRKGVRRIQNGKVVPATHDHFAVDESNALDNSSTSSTNE